jgi:hypothetical protein
MLGSSLPEAVCLQRVWMWGPRPWALGMYAVLTTCVGAGYLCADIPPGTSSDAWTISQHQTLPCVSSSEACCVVVTQQLRSR